MPKTAAIELDSTIAHLRVYINSARRHAATHQLFLPEVSENQLRDAAYALFEERLRVHLPNLREGYGARLRNRTTSVDPYLNEQLFTIFGWAAELVQETYSAVVVSAVDEALEYEIGQNIMDGLDYQISRTIGPDVYYAWHYRRVDTAVILSAGGLLINLDRLRNLSGVVELDIRAHWEEHLSDEEQADLDRQRAHLVKSIPKVQKLDPNAPKVTSTAVGLKHLKDQPRRNDELTAEDLRRRMARVLQPLEDVLADIPPPPAVSDEPDDQAAVTIIYNGKSIKDRKIIPKHGFARGTRRRKS